MSPCEIIAAAFSDQDGYAKLSYLCDRIGNRLSGSPALNDAIQWAAAQMKRDGLENVSTPAVKVPHWVRGREEATLIAPVHHTLTMLGLGGSVATPPDGITAQVVSVDTFDALNALGREKIAGKIVLFNVPYEGYGKTVTYRATGPSRAARLGAVAMLLRSVGRSPCKRRTPVRCSIPKTTLKSRQPPSHSKMPRSSNASAIRANPSRSTCTWKRTCCPTPIPRMSWERSRAREAR